MQLAQSRRTGPTSPRHSYRLMRIGLRDPMLDALRSKRTEQHDPRWLTAGVHERPFAPMAELELQQKLLRTVGYAEAAAQRGHDLSAVCSVLGVGERMLERTFQEAGELLGQSADFHHCRAMGVLGPVHL